MYPILFICFTFRFCFLYYLYFFSVAFILSFACMYLSQNIYQTNILHFDHCLPLVFHGPIYCSTLVFHGPVYFVTLCFVGLYSI